MKKQIILGVAFAVSANFAFAAATVRTGADLQTHLKDATKESGHEAAGAPRVGEANKVALKATEISKIGGADLTELRAALNKTVKAKTPTGEVSLPLLQVAEKLLLADKTLKNLNRNDLDAAGKIHYDAMENAVKAASKFLSMANKMSAGESEEVKVFNKQLWIIDSKLAEMDTADLVSHTVKMEAALASRTTPGITGDQAFAASLKQGKTAAEYAQLLKDILGCI